MSIYLNSSFVVATVYEDAVTIKWTASIGGDGEYPDSHKKTIIITCTNQNDNNDTLEISKTLSSTSGNITITGLMSGQKYRIQAEFELKYWYDNPNKEDGEDADYHGYDEDIYFYTHPGEWDWGFVSGTIIRGNLTAEKVSNWVQHLKKYIRWENQKELTETQKEKYSKQYDPNIEKDTKEKSKGGLLVNSGDIIYLEWFNNCIKEKHGNETNLVLTRENNGDLITANVFNLLNFDSYKYE